MQVSFPLALRFELHARLVAIDELDASGLECALHGLNFIRVVTSPASLETSHGRDCNPCRVGKLLRCPIKQPSGGSTLRRDHFRLPFAFRNLQRRCISALLPRSAGRPAVAPLRSAIPMPGQSGIAHPFSALSFTPLPFSSMNSTPAASRGRRRARCGTNTRRGARISRRQVRRRSAFAPGAISGRSLEHPHQGAARGWLSIPSPVFVWSLALAKVPRKCQLHCRSRGFGHVRKSAHNRGRQSSLLN